MQVSLIRSWLFVPGHQQRMIEKSMGLQVNAVIFDLEDGVPPNKKESARSLINAALGRRADRPSLFVRVHEAQSSALVEDLLATVNPGMDGLVLPKVESPEDIQRVDAMLQDREIETGLGRGTIRLVAMIESAKGLIHAPGIAASSSRLVGLMFGAEDFALDLGFLDAGQNRAPEYLYARSSLVVAAASRNLQAIDRVCVNVHEPEVLLADSRQARELGFTGKALIHPDQIRTIHEVFTPTPGEIEYARRLVEAFEKADPGGRGIVLVDGRMVDRPVAERARRMLEAWHEWS
jgi:citrate lyase subunit beta/citryl-CoA lyase